VVRQQIVLPGVLDHVRRLRRLRVHEHDGPPQPGRLGAQPGPRRFLADVVDARRRHLQSALQDRARQLAGGAHGALARLDLARALGAQGGAAGHEARGQGLELGARGRIGRRGVERRGQRRVVRRFRVAGCSSRAAAAAAAAAAAGRLSSCLGRSPLLPLLLLLALLAPRHRHPAPAKQRRRPRKLAQLERRPRRPVPRLGVVRPQARGRLAVAQGVPPVAQEDLDVRAVAQERGVQERVGRAHRDALAVKVHRVAQQQPVAALEADAHLVVPLRLEVLGALVGRGLGLERLQGGKVRVGLRVVRHGVPEEGGELLLLVAAVVFAVGGGFGVVGGGGLLGGLGRGAAAAAALVRVGVAHDVGVAR